MTATSFWLHVATVAAMAIFITWLWGRASARPMRAGLLTAALIVAWLAYTGVLAASGFTQRVDILPPGPAAVLGPGLLILIVVLVAMGRPGNRVTLERMPLVALLLAQTFRVPVEIVLAMLVEGGKLPALLSYHGSNFDILTGLTAPLAAWAAARGMQRTVLIWNLLGLALVFNVAISAILSGPPPLQVIKVEPTSIFVVAWPMVWLPGFLVPVAVLLHGLAMMRLRRE
jgi:hypothetical protein